MTKPWLCTSKPMGEDNKDVVHLLMMGRMMMDSYDMMMGHCCKTVDN